jgi:hypothetical protein
MLLTIVQAREGNLAGEDLPHKDTECVHVTRGAKPAQPQQFRRPASSTDSMPAESLTVS